MQTIDPIKPQLPQRSRPVEPGPPHPREVSRGRFIDGVPITPPRRQPPARSSTLAPGRQLAKQAPAPPKPTQAQPVARPSKTPALLGRQTLQPTSRRFAAIFMTVGSITLPILAYGGVIGQLLLGLYLLLAIIMKLESRLTFALALVALLYVPLLQLLGQERWAHYMAVFAYSFLTIGVLSLILELRRQGKLGRQKISK